MQRCKKWFFENRGTYLRECTDSGCFVVSVAFDWRDCCLWVEDDVITFWGFKKSDGVYRLWTSLESLSFVIRSWWFGCHTRCILGRMQDAILDSCKMQVQGSCKMQFGIHARCDLGSIQDANLGSMQDANFGIHARCNSKFMQYAIWEACKMQIML